MKKKKIILIIILLILTLLLIGLLVLKNGDINNSEKIVQTNERDETKEQVEIVNDYINIREENDSQSKLLGEVHKGEIYTILDKKEDDYYTWCQIETSNGIKGYIAVKYLEDIYVNFLDTVSEVSIDNNEE